MTLDRIGGSWGPYEALIPFAKVESRLRVPMEVVGEAIESLLPSIELGPEGPLVKSVFLFTESYLCEVRLSDRNEDNFDFALRRLMFNLRVQLAERTVKRADGGEAVFQLASIQVKHTGSFHSEFNYAGTQRKAWFDAVLAAFPMTLLGQAAPPTRQAADRGV